DLALGDGLAELRHQHVHAFPFPPPSSPGRRHKRVHARLQRAMAARPGDLDSIGTPYPPDRDRRVKPGDASSVCRITYQLTEMYCVSMNSSMPSCAPSRPTPDCFVPPNGAAGSETRPRLRPIMPKSSFSETRMPRLRSLV